MMKRFIADPSFWELFPNAAIGVLTVKDIDEAAQLGPEQAAEVYDAAGVVCRCWNWRDGKRTAVKDATTAEFIAMECVDPARLDDLKDALDELAGLLEKYTGAKVVSKGVVNSASREILIQE